jgi:hypothetical protein
MAAEQLTVEHVDRDWEIHDGHGEIVGVFGTRLGAVRFAECFTGDVVVLTRVADADFLA